MLMQWKDQTGPESQLRVAVDDQSDKADHGQAVLGDADHFRQARTDQVHVVDDARHEHAHPRFAEEIHGQADDFGKEFVTELFQHLEPAVGYEEFLNKKTHTFDQKYANQVRERWGIRF